MSQAKSHSAAASTVLSLAILSAPLGLVVLNSDGSVPQAGDHDWARPGTVVSGVVARNHHDAGRVDRQARSWLLDRQRAAMASPLQQSGPAGEGLGAAPGGETSPEMTAWAYPTLTF